MYVYITETMAFNMTLKTISGKLPHRYDDFKSTHLQYFQPLP